MKHITEISTSEFIFDNIEVGICPAGYKKCNCDDKTRSVEFKRVDLFAGQLLKKADEKKNRIVFLVDGSLRVRIEGKSDFDLNAGQTVFLVHGCNAEITATSDALMYLLDSSNKILFCKHYVLSSLTDYGGDINESATILPIPPQISLFLRGLMLSSKEMNKPCYHMMKEYEFVIIAWYAYGTERLRSFFRDALTPRDDFKAFVLNSYDKVDTMQQLARLSNMSLSTFRRFFTDTFGETYQSWRMKQKARKIVEAIEDGVMSNAEIMRQLGFKSYPAFYRFCTKHLDKNPTMLKEKYASNSQLFRNTD